MSLYQVDKVLHEVGRFEEPAQAFLADAQGYLAERDLEEHERRALAECDFRSLWSMGAHPFILLGFVRRVLTARDFTPQEALKEYKEGIAPLGRPDYST